MEQRYASEYPTTDVKWAVDGMTAEYADDIRADLLTDEDKTRIRKEIVKCFKIYLQQVTFDAERVQIRKRLKVIPGGLQVKPDE